MSQIIGNYSVTTFPGKNKLDKIPKDENGYHRIILGGFNLANESGIYYPLTNQVKSLFEKDSSILRKLKKGQCFSEVGHPNILNMPEHIALQRLQQVDETNTCAHLKSVSLEADKDENGNEVVLAYGLVKPDGAKYFVLEKALENIERDLAFSIRSFADMSVEGFKRIRKVFEVITYDYVNEPGIRRATRYNTAAALEQLIDYHFTKENLERAIEESGKYGNESYAMEELKMIKTHYGWQEVNVITPITLPNKLSSLNI